MATLNFDQASSLGIDGLTWTPKRIIADERGAVMHMLKTASLDAPVAEIYFSLVKPSVLKGWKFHKQMTQRFCVPMGCISFVFVDERDGSRTKGKIVKLECSQHNYGIITVPAELWYSFRGEAETDSLIVNAASMVHTPGESLVCDPSDFKSYHWT